MSDFIPKANSRNRKRTAFRRYLKFLKRTGEIKTVPQIFDEATKRDSRETIIPGELPTWDDVLTYLKSLKPGRYRFLRTISNKTAIRANPAYVPRQVTNGDLVARLSFGFWQNCFDKKYSDINRWAYNRILKSRVVAAHQIISSITSVHNDLKELNDLKIGSLIKKKFSIIMTWIKNTKKS